VAKNKVKRKVPFNKLEQAVITGGLLGVDAWAKLTAQRAGQYAPVDTATLSQSIIKDPAGPKFFRDGADLKFTHRVGSGLEYAFVQEYGSGKYSETPEGAPQRPRRAYPIIAGALQSPPLEGGKKALAFFWPNAPKGMEPTGEDGKFLFSYVMHPGVRPKHYLRDARRDTAKEGTKLFWDAIKVQMMRAFAES
jgi:hypothetical protein